jgi:riboflavin synthase
MFTGIVEERGEVRSAGPGRLEIGCRTVVEGSDAGASVAVNGVCLTVVHRGEGHLRFDLSEETLRRTSLGRLREGDPVNLERPVTFSTRLGGHLVQGHVDGVGSIAALERSHDDATLIVRPPLGLERYLAEKGSVAVDGVSLTVARLHEGAFEVALIPHTMEATTFGSSAVGDPVNLEVDVIAKYVERLLQGRSR